MCLGRTGFPGSPGSKGESGQVGNPGATGPTGLLVQAIHRRVARQAGCPGKFQYTHSVTAAVSVVGYVADLASV